MRMLKIAGIVVVLAGLALAGHFTSAAELMNVVYTLTPPTVSVASDHTISFKTPSALSSGTLTLYLRNVVSSMGSTTITSADIDFSHGASLASQTQYALSSSAGSATWGVAVNTISKTITFTYPTSNGVQVAAQEYVVIKIGKNADGGVLNAGASNNQMINSASATTRTFTVVVQPTGGVAPHVGTGYASGGTLGYGTSTVPAPPAPAPADTGGTPSMGSVGGTGSSSGSTSSTTSGTGTSGTGTSSSSGTTSGTTTSPSSTPSGTQTTTTTTTTTQSPPPPSSSQTPPPPAELSVTTGGKATGLSVDFTCAASGGTSPYATYSWVFGDEGIGTGATITHIYKAAGSYTAMCTVKDSTGKSANGSTSIQVSEILSATITDTTTELTSTLTCVASGGKAPYSYLLDFGDGATATEATATHGYKSAGLYSASCVVTDSLSKTAKASKTVATIEPLSLNAGVKLNADASVKLSQSVDGFAQVNTGLTVYGTCDAKGGVGPYSYSWDFGDGSSSTLASVAHKYFDIGIKTARCTASDARGKSLASNPMTITVKKGLDVKTIASAKGGAATIVVDLPISLTCEASGGTPAYTYQWKIADENGKDILSDSSLSTVSNREYTFGSSGTFVVSCVVRDKDGHEQTDSISVGVASVELSKAVNTTEAEVTKAIDVALSEGANKVVSETQAILSQSATQSSASSEGPLQGTQSGESQAGASSGALATSPSPIQPQSTLFTDTGNAGAPVVELPPAGSSETVPNVSQNSINMTISTSAPVTGALCEQVGIKNADNAIEMFVWYCPQEQVRPVSLLARIKLAALNAWYGLKKLALGVEQTTAKSQPVRKQSVQTPGISLDLNQSLQAELSSSIEKKLLQESKLLMRSNVKHANAQQLSRLPATIKMVLQSGLQNIEAYSLDGVRLGDPLQINDFSNVLVMKKSFAGRVIEVIVPEDFSTDKAVEIVANDGSFFNNEVHERSKNQVIEIQKEFNALAKKAYEEGLSVLRKRYAKEITLSSDVDDALQKTVLQRLQLEQVQRQLIDLARGTVVQQVALRSAARAAQDEEAVVPGQQPTLSQLFRTPNSITIAPLNQGQAEKLLKQDLVLPDFPGSKPIPNQIKEVGVLDASGMGLVKLPAPMKLTMCWDESLLKAMNISIDPADPSKNMCIGHFNPATGTGRCEQSVFDMISKCATAQVDSVSIFALFGKAGTDAVVASATENKPRVDINVVPSVRLRLVESLIDSEDLGIHQTEEAITPSDVIGKIYIAPSTQLSLCVSPNVFLKKVKGISISIGSKTQALLYEQSRECFSGTITTPNERGVNKVQMRVVYIDDQVQTISINTVVTNKLRAIILNQIALPVNEVGKIVAAVNEQVKQTVEVAQPALQTTAIATAPVIVISNPAVLTNTINWYHYLNHLFSWFLSFLGFRKKRKPWGVVYDAAAKHPLDLAVVRLFDAKTKKLIETQVTDKQGRFSFLTSVGTYSISVAKPPFTFPSAIVKDHNDGDFSNVYRQEDIVITKPDQVMSISIPIDPPTREHMGEVTFLQQISRFFKKHSSGSLIAGLVISGALAFYTPSAINAILLGINGVYVLFQFVITGRTEKPWGVIFSTETLEPIPLAAISIIDAKENKVLRTRLSDYYGRFNFLTPPGDYSVIVSKDAYQFPAPESAPVRKYRDIYRGGTVKIKKNKGYVHINVPLIPKGKPSLTKT